MITNYTKKALVEGIKTFQKKERGLKKSQSINKLTTQELSLEERGFIESRDVFSIASTGEDGWPYMESIQGDRGVLKVISTTQIVFVNCKDDLQCLPLCEQNSMNRAILTLIDYPTGLSLKIWVEITFANSENKLLRDQLLLEKNTIPVEDFIVMNIKAFDWNCAYNRTSRYCIEEFNTMLNNNEISLDCETARKQLIKYLKLAENFTD